MSDVVEGMREISSKLIDKRGVTMEIEEMIANIDKKQNARRQIKLFAEIKGI